MEFVVVCDVKKLSDDICDELNSVPVVVQHVISAKKKNASDEKLRQVEILHSVYHHVSLDAVSIAPGYAEVRGHICWRWESSFTRPHIGRRGLCCRPFWYVEYYSFYPSCVALYSRRQLNVNSMTLFLLIPWDV